MNTMTLNTLAVAAAFGLPLAPVEAQNILVDLELSLVTDVSGSVSLSEYQLMMDGYESAFRNPSIINAIQSGNQGSIAVNLVFFASSASEGLPFTLISNSTEANAFADDIFALRNSKPFGGGTTISSGINLAAQLFDQNGFDAPRQVIDVAGDGTGTSPGSARDSAINSGVDTINGIVIGSDPGGSLAQFYQNEVIAGQGAFVAVAPTFQDFEPEIQRKIEREVRGTDFGSESGRIVTSTLRLTSIATARTTVRGVSDRMFRMRSGQRSEPIVTETPAPYSGKGGMTKEPIVVTTYCPWEVWGKVYWATEDLDAQYNRIAVPGANFRQLIQADTSIDIYGGAIGIEYHINPTWAVGFAISGSRGEADMTLVGSADIDTIALMPYVSYYRNLGNMDVYADLLYGYGMTEYDTVRLAGGPATGSPDGNFHTLEFNTGLNLSHGGFVHGPFGQIRWIDGEIDAFTEVGPGALTFPEADYESLATQLGYQASYPIAMGSGTFVPQARAAWEHEFEDDAGNLAGLPQGTIDEDVAVLGLGFGYFMNCGWNVILDYEARLGSDSQSHYVGLKGGIEF